MKIEKNIKIKEAANCCIRQCEILELKNLVLILLKKKIMYDIKHMYNLGGKHIHRFENI